MNQAPLTVTATNETKTYGQDVSSQLSGTIAGLVNGDNITASYASAGAAAVAAASTTPYTINATLSDPGSKLGNYSVTLSTGSLTVNQAPLTVAPVNKTKTYGQDATSQLSGTITGLVNGDNKSERTEQTPCKIP